MHADVAYMEGFPGTKPKTQCIQMCLHKLKVVCGPSGLDPRTCFPNFLEAFNGKLQGWHPLYTSATKFLSEVPRRFLFKWDIMEVYVSNKQVEKKPKPILKVTPNVCVLLANLGDITLNLYAIAPRFGAIAPKFGAIAPNFGAIAQRFGAIAPRFGANTYSELLLRHGAEISAL